MQDTREHSMAEEWLPSRFNLATFRMLGLLVARTMTRKPSIATVLHHDREQHPLEAYTLSCALIAIPSVHFLVPIVPTLRWPWVMAPLLVLGAPFAATFAWDLVVFSVAFTAFVLRKLTRLEVRAIRLQTPVIYSLMLALSAASIAYDWKTAWLGAAWLALTALNALCAIALWVSRDRVSGFVREVSQTP